MRPAADRVRVLAPAKLNLTLRVLGRRRDGYHELASTMVAIDRCDMVEVRFDVGTEPGSLRLDIEGPQHAGDVPADPTNSAWRAASAVARLAADRGSAAPAGIAVRLEKHVPSQAGLGGGSSDAAAAALATARLFGLDPDHDGELEAAIAAELGRIGSDCPFFFLARASGYGRVTGRGERVVVHPAPGPDERAFAIVTPAARCSTASIYRALDAPPFRGTASVRSGERTSDALAGALDAGRARLGNDLEPAAEASAPSLSAWRELLDSVGAGHARLCGSGSSYFAMYADRNRAEAALRKWTTAAKARDLGLRAEFVARPSGFGANVFEGK